MNGGGFVSSVPPDPINEVAAVIDSTWTFEADDDEHPAREIAQALAEAGWLRTAEDRDDYWEQQRYNDAIHSEVERLRKERDWLIEWPTDDSRYTSNMTGSEVHEADYCRNLLAKFEREFGRVAVGGSVPADPEGTA